MTNIITLKDKENRTITLAGDLCSTDGDSTIILPVNDDTPIVINGVDTVLCETVDEDDERLDDAMQLTAEISYRQKCMTAAKLDVAYAYATFR